MVSWLAPAAWLYGRAVARRRAAARRQPPARLPVPAVSVGNLTTGGTGKTEAVRWLCQDLLRRGRRPGILSRGYGRRSRQPVLVVSRGRGPEIRVEEAGDEPFLLAQSLPAVPVVVGADRWRTGQEAAALGCDVLVLDDGFQRRDQVARDLDLVLLDAADPFGGGRLLPAGRLREPVDALREAGAVLVTRTDHYSPEAAVAGVRRIAPGLPVFLSRHASDQVRTLDQGSRQDPSVLQGRRVVAVSAIARPEAFERQLTSLGAEMAGQVRFRDHHWFTAADRRRVLRRARRLGADVVLTSKDAVRWPGPDAGDPSVLCLDVRLDVLSPEWPAWLERIWRRLFSRATGAES